MPKISTLTSITILLALIAPLSMGQERVPELLRGVDDYKAQRVVEYNGVWLQAELYSAKRFRIVIVDTSLLLKDDDFTVTPFDDVTPIHLTQESVHRWEDTVAWTALMKIDVPALLKIAGMRPTVLLSMIAWDTDESGNAFYSSDNRFEFSSDWTFDDLNRPVLRTPPGEQGGVAGPPPQTPAEIARHRQLLRLNKHAFYSVSAAFELFPETKYRLVPLNYTPKYSVIYEIDPERQVLFIVDEPPDGVPLNRSAEADARLADYENFIRSLPSEENVPVVEDIQ
ncbi:MAG TPA: hypothetical protein VIM81_00030 [Gammaproteobacteria bacterium]